MSSMQKKLSLYKMSNCFNYYVHVHDSQIRYIIEFASCNNIYNSTNRQQLNAGISCLLVGQMGKWHLCSGPAGRREDVAAPPAPACLSPRPTHSPAQHTRTGKYSTVVHSIVSNMSLVFNILLAYETNNHFLLNPIKSIIYIQICI